MKIAICEDDIKQCNLLNTQIEKWANDKKNNIEIDSFATAEAFLFEWVDYNKYDIIFLDIKLSKISGVELSNIIRERNKDVDIVFITGFFKYALHGYKVGALQYLIKPIDIADLYFCLDKTVERVSNKDKKGIFILETPKKIFKLHFSDIYYCVMFSPYIDINTDSEKITLRKKISELEKFLSKEYFIRCHRSYIVNLMHIKSISKSDILLKNGIKVPISRSKYKEVNDAFINYVCE